MRQSGFVMGAGRWYHLAVVWEPKRQGSPATDTRLYIDGVLFGELNWQVTKGLGDWTGNVIRIGSDVPLEIDDLRISSVPRYKADFDPSPLAAADEHTLAQLDFEDNLPAFAKLVK
jgi:hypothetical protein